MPKLSWKTLARGPADTQHEHGDVISRDKDDESGSTFQGGPSLLHSGKHTHGFHNILGTRITPFDIGRVHSWKMEMAFSLMTRFVFLDLTVLWTLLCVESY